MSSFTNFERRPCIVRPEAGWQPKGRPDLETELSGAPAQIVLGNRVHLNRDLVPTQVPTPPGRELADGLDTIPDRTRRFEVKAYVEHLTHAH
jgi:hypothetical protein